MSGVAERDQCICTKERGLTGDDAESMETLKINKGVLLSAF
jgi:hypothetical protein